MSVLDDAANSQSTPQAQPAAPAAPAQGGSVLDQAAAEQPSTTAVTPSAPVESTTDRWKRQAYETIGKILPQSTVGPSMQFSKENLSEPFEKFESGIVEKGGEIGRIPAEALTFFQNMGAYMPSPTGPRGQAIEPVEEAAKRLHPTLSGVGEGAGKFAGSMVTPSNLALLAAMPEVEAGSLLSKVVATGFAAQMGAGVKDSINNLSENWGKMSEQERASALTQLPLQAIVTALSFMHAGKEIIGEPKAKVPTPETVGPTAGGEGPQTSTQTGTVTGKGEGPLSTTQTRTTAGVEAPVSARGAATLAGDQPSILTQAAEALTTPSAATEFGKTQTAPAATRQAQSTVGQVAEDRIAQHNAIVNGTTNPESITGTQQPSKFTSPDDAWQEMQKTAQNTTFRKADDISQREQKSWEGQRDQAVQEYKDLVDRHNKNIDDYNAQVPKDQRMPQAVFNPAEVSVPERPQTYNELRSDVQTEQANARSQDAAVREEAIKNGLPKAEKAMDNWFKQHSDEVSPAEYDSVKKLWADSERMKEIAMGLRGPITKGNLTGNQMRQIEVSMNNRQIRRGQAPDAFQRLLGPDGYNNWQNVTKLFDTVKDPTLPPQFRSWGHYAADFLVSALIPGIAGKVAGIAGIEGLRWGTEKLLNHVMFDPEFGETFGHVTDWLKEQKGRVVDSITELPANLRDKLVSIIKSYKDAGERGAVGADVQQGNTPDTNKFGRAGLGGTEAADQAARDQAEQMRAQAATPPPAPEPAPAEALPEAKPVVQQGDEEKAALQNKEIATRRPTAVGADLTNNPETTATLDALTGKTKETVAQAIAGYKDNGLKLSDDQMENPSEHADAIIKKAVAHYKNNLVDLYNRIPESIRGISKQWYDSAHELSKTMANRFGIAHEQAAAVIASLSPNNPWDNNVGMAERLMDRWKNDKGRIWDEKMDEKLSTIRNAKSTKPEFRGLLDSVRGQNYADLTASTNAALRVKQGLWLRMVDQAYGDPQIPVYAPEGTIRGSQKIAWGPYDAVAKAVDILENGSIQNINDLMGQGHKIRNFYNNIISPNSTRGHVTIDTHAVDAAHWKPFSQKDVEVAHNFGGSVPGTPGAGKNAASGLQGTYPVYAEAYKQAAAEVGVSPRELQSITWEGIRSLMSRENKKGTIRQDVAKIWRDHEAGKITIDQARDKIVESAGGFKRPVWTTDAQWQGATPATPALEEPIHQMVTLGQGPFSITADATPPPQSPEVTAKWKGTPQPKLGNTPAGRPDFSGKYGVGLQDIADHMNVNATPDEVAISAAHEIAHAFVQHTLGSTEGMAIGLGNKPIRRGTEVEGGSKSSQDGISGGYVEPGKSWNTRYRESMDDPEKLKSFLKDYTTQLMAGKAMEELLGRSFTERENHAQADNAMARNVLKQTRVPSVLHDSLLRSATEIAKKLLQDNFATLSHMTKQAVNHYGGKRFDEATFHKYRQGGVYEK